jgi:hypothetical protein
MVLRVSNNDVVVPVHCDSKGRVEHNHAPFSVSIALDASARQSGHFALWCDLADTVVETVSHDDIATLIYCDSRLGWLN